MAWYHSFIKFIETWCFWELAQNWITSLFQLGFWESGKGRFWKKKFRKLSPMTHTHKVCFYQFLNSPSEKIGSPQRIALFLPMAWGWSCNGKVSCVEYLILNLHHFWWLLTVYLIDLETPSIPAVCINFKLDLAPRSQLEWLLSAALMLRAQWKLHSVCPAILTMRANVGSVSVA